MKLIRGYRLTRTWIAPKIMFIMKTKEREKRRGKTEPETLFRNESSPYYLTNIWSLRFWDLFNAPEILVFGRKVFLFFCRRSVHIEAQRDTSKPNRISNHTYIYKNKRNVSEMFDHEQTQKKANRKWKQASKFLVCSLFHSYECCWGLSFNFILKFMPCQFMAAFFVTTTNLVWWLLAAVRSILDNFVLVFRVGI